MVEPEQSDPARIYEEYLGRSPRSWASEERSPASTSIRGCSLWHVRSTRPTGRQSSGCKVMPLRCSYPTALSISSCASRDCSSSPIGRERFAKCAGCSLRGGRTAISVWQSLDHHPLYESLFRATVQHLNAEIADVALSFSLGSAHDLKSLLIEANFRDVQVIPRSHEVRLPSPERFVAFTVLGAATSVPAFAALDEPRRAALIDAIVRDTRAAVETFRREMNWSFRCRRTS